MRNQFRQSSLFMVLVVLFAGCLGFSGPTEGLALPITYQLVPGSGPTGQFTYDASTLSLTQVNIDWGGGWFNWKGADIVTFRPDGFDFESRNVHAPEVPPGMPPEPVTIYRLDFSVYLNDLKFLAHACVGSPTGCFSSPESHRVSGGSLIAVPEISSVWLLLLGAIGILGTRQLTRHHSTE